MLTNEQKDLLISVHAEMCSDFSAKELYDHVYGGLTDEQEVDLYNSYQLDD